MEITNTSYINYQENVFLNSMAQSLALKNHSGAELISPLILGILNQSDFTSFMSGIFTPSFSTFETVLSQRSYSENRDYKNFIMRCQKVVDTIIDKRRAIFDTSYSDRLVITKAINLLEQSFGYYHLQTNKNDELAIQQLNETKTHLNKLKNAIESCESIKAKYLSPLNQLLSLPTELQPRIFSLTPYPKVLNSIKILYSENYNENTLYQKVLPEFINKRQLIQLYTLKNYFSLCEIMQTVPHLQLLSDYKIEDKTLFDVMSVNEFKSAKSLEIRGSEVILRFLSDIIKMPSLEHLSLTCRKGEMIHPFSAFLDQLKNLKHLKKLKLMIDTTDSNLTQANILAELDMNNVEVHVHLIKRSGYAPSKQLTPVF